MSRHCDCDGPPWPLMMRIHAGGVPAIFHLCQDCGTIREDVTRRDGTIYATRFYSLDSDGPPASVTVQARDILDRPKFTQMDLFGDDG